MNTSRMLELANFLESLGDEKFDMNRWRVETVCGTVGCIAGWAVECYVPEEIVGKIGVNLSAKDALGIDFRVADALFVPSASDYDTAGVNYGRVNGQVAAEVLRGVVDAYQTFGEIGYYDVMEVWMQTDAWQN